MKIYGIPNCNTVKKAQNWLTENGLQYTFHNFKKEGISEEKLNQWCATFGWENVLNKKGTTWRKLSPEQQEAIKDQASAVNLLLEHTSAIKRPIIENHEQALLLGFNEEQYEAALSTT